MNTAYLGMILADLIAKHSCKCVILIVKVSGGSGRYENMVLIHERCSVERTGTGDVKKVTIVARKPNYGDGPFLFLWPPKTVNNIDQPACLGMPLAAVE